MSDQPTTSEWTVSTIDKWISLNPSTWRSVIAFEHEAALAAEREKARVAWRRVVTLEQQLAARDSFAKRVEKQLAAERERRKREMADYETLCGDLQKQLGAEREKVILATQMVQIEGKRANEAEKQLAKAQAAIWRHNEEDAAIDCEAIELTDTAALDAAIEKARAGERANYEDWRPPPIAGDWIAHQSENPKYPEEWDVFEGGNRGYSVIGDGFITEGQAKEIALRHNLAIAAAKEEVRKEWALSESKRDIMSKMKISEIEELRAAQRPLVDAVRFFASVIKSGESWSPTCQKAYDAALDEAVDAVEQEILLLRQQLAAERLEVEERGRTIIHYKQQLAAARTVIDRGVEIVTTDQLGSWTGVRAWLETN